MFRPLRRRGAVAGRHGGGPVGDTAGSRRSSRRGGSGGGSGDDGDGPGAGGPVVGDSTPGGTVVAAQATLTQPGTALRRLPPGGSRCPVASSTPCAYSLVGVTGERGGVGVYGVGAACDPPEWAVLTAAGRAGGRGGPAARLQPVQGEPVGTADP